MKRIGFQNEAESGSFPLSVRAGKCKGCRDSRKDGMRPACQ